MTPQGDTWPRDIAVCIPAYMAKDSLEIFLPRLLQRVAKQCVHVIDDGSHDGTDGLCQHVGIHCISMAVNQGKGAALRQGFAHCLSLHQELTWILTMDADNQHDPQDIDHFLATAQTHPESGLIIGSREKKLGAMPPARIVSNTLTSAFLSLITKQKIDDSQCGFRLYATTLLRRITLTYTRFEMETEVILKAAFCGFPIHSTPIKTLYCSEQSHISHLKDMTRWIVAVVRTWLVNRFSV
ncbi:MAG: glycosyltransferase family 2 protein [Chitinivibrionales bacterium]|nr:glycosyltransferase family 2 protein [Chitinivibrionales bacterium]